MSGAVYALPVSSDDLWQNAEITKWSSQHPIEEGTLAKDRKLNNLNNITRLLARLLRCVKAHIRKV
jgi:hypothetical protein